MVFGCKLANRRLRDAANGPPEMRPEQDEETSAQCRAYKVHRLTWEELYRHVVLQVALR
jgi:hypothetical protein